MVESSTGESTGAAGQTGAAVANEQPMQLVELLSSVLPKPQALLPGGADLGAVLSLALHGARAQHAFLPAEASAAGPRRAAT